MKIDVGREGPAAFRCDIYLEGEDDPPYVRIHRGGTVVSEVACNTVADAETMWREVEIARRLEAFPVRLHTVLTEMVGDYPGMPGDGSPEQRRKAYAEGFLAALRGEQPTKPMGQTWLAGQKAGRMILDESNALFAVFRNGPPRPIK